MGFFDFFKAKPKAGDIVICIDDRNWNSDITNITLQYNKKYKLLDILKICHGYALDIGGRVSNGSYTSCTCRKSIQGRGIHWAGLERFRIATEEEASEFREGENEDEGDIDDIDNKIANAILEEDYELAGELTERKNN